MKRLLCALIFLVGPAATLWASHPNEAPGFVADRVYSVHDVDTVNAFNGNLNLRIPLGPELKVNGQLSYSLSLTYNCHFWRFDDNQFLYDPGDGILVTEDQFTAVPPQSDNAGLGWRLSLGKLYSGVDPDTYASNSTSWIYQSSDGADHNFYDSPITGDDSSAPPPLYSRDGTHLRLSVSNGAMLVEFPDGTVQTFTQLQQVSDGGWLVSATSGQWFLTRISDAFGNAVDIVYSSALSSTPAYKEIWTFENNNINTAIVYFKSGMTSSFNATLDHINMPSASGTTLSYSFHTELVQIPAPLGDNTGRTLPVPVLTAITPSVGNGYSMTDGNVPFYEAASNASAGVLTRIILPTLGSIGWTFEPIPFANGAKDHRSPAIEHPFGVTARTTYDAAGQNPATWNYLRQFSYPEFCQVSFPTSCDTVPPCSSGRARQLTVFITDPPTPGGDTKTTINYFSNYEVIPDPNGETCGSGSQGWLNAEHGLPFTRYAQRNGRFLSSEVRTNVNFQDPALAAWESGTTAGQGQVPLSVGTRFRETWLNYRLDADAASDLVYFDKNASLSSSATYNIDDPFVANDPSDPNQNDNCGTAQVPCFTATNYFGYDDYGHYRQASTDGNLPGNGNFRTTFTNYSAAPTTSSWLLTPFTEQCSVNESSARTNDLNASGGCSALAGAFMTKTQFDAHGAVTAHRTLVQSLGALDSRDLLATFAYDSYGNMTGEQYYGGDMHPLAMDAGTFAPGSSVADYSIAHVLTYGTGSLLQDTATYANGVTSSDVSLDQFTGMVTKVRDIAGLDTHYVYDALGRLTQVQPPGVAETTYTYTEAMPGTVFNPATVDSLTDGSLNGLGTVHKVYEYDPLGRLMRQKSLLDDGVTWSITQTDFDPLGRKTAVSTPEKLVGSESSFAPAHQTKYTSYDPFGRPLGIQAPDLSLTTIAYRGTRRVDRTVNIATTSTGSAASTTLEIHDALGRLFRVIEPSGATSLSSPAGAPVTTEYTYDSADHLIQVSTPPQNRSFSYDHRGFLTQETHPEIGQNGNGTIQYVYTAPNAPAPTAGYDARGHLHLKLTGSVNGPLDLRLGYDASERPASVSDNGGTQLLKEYSYWPANDTASPPNLGRGKLYQAISHNHPVSLAPAEAVVTETYTYATPDQSGRISQRDTLVESVNGGSRTTLQSFTQNVTYDHLGSTAQIDYPICKSDAPCASPAAAGPAYTHKNGFLVGVSGYASPITYNADGSVFEVTHAGTVKDTYTPDTSGMSRPGVISFAGETACPASATIVSGDTTISAGLSTAITVNLGGTGPWNIFWSDGAQDPAVQTSPRVRSVSPASTTRYTVTSVTDHSGCSAAGSGAEVVTVQACAAGATMRPGGIINAGQSIQIAADLAGTGPWTIVWSDGIHPPFTQNGVTQSPWTQTFFPIVNTAYTITSVTDSTGCSRPGTGSAMVTVIPIGLRATTNANTLSVTVQWNMVSGAGWYQVERATHIDPLSDWAPIGRVSANTPTYPDTSFAPTSPATYLYRVRIGVTAANGVEFTSAPSVLDYATIATVLFSDEPLTAGVTRIKGVHVGELRQAIDAVRRAANLSAAWTSYAPATGPVTAADNLQARQQLDQAVNLLLLHGVAYTGETPAANGKIWTYQLQQIRDGVR
ncbi:MAG TPA: hypothetical protein VLC46_27800 [Thermoanaerobaculia bacterium]|jgi:YD repeat-containing protein|nr:hypothetical protein [Thermoanaerobaculia bacterium]